MEKMSVVLCRFFEPYVKGDETLKEYRTHVSFSIIAWNCALLPEEEREAFIAEAAETFDHRGRAEFSSRLNALVERKQRHFAHYTRFIVDFEVTDGGDEFHLAVASSMD